jgi:hypothetical protein
MKICPVPESKEDDMLEFDFVESYTNGGMTKRPSGLVCFRDIPRPAEVAYGSKKTECLGNPANLQRCIGFEDGARKVIWVSDNSWPGPIPVRRCLRVSSRAVAKVVTYLLGYDGDDVCPEYEKAIAQAESYVKRIADVLPAQECDFCGRPAVSALVVNGMILYGCCAEIHASALSEVKRRHEDLGDHTALLETPDFGGVTSGLAHVASQDTRQAGVHAHG